MTYTVKDWHDEPATDTPLYAADLVDTESRIVAYARTLDPAFTAEYTPKEWHNDPLTGVAPTGTDTPLDAAALIDVETRIYTWMLSLDANFVDPGFTVKQWQDAPADWQRGDPLPAGATPIDAAALKDMEGRLTGLIDLLVARRDAQAAPAVPPSNTTAPTISGVLTVGETLTGNVGTWDGDGLTFAVQWLRDGADIAGATDTTYTLVDADQDHTPGFRVTATNAAGTASATATETATVAPADVPFNPDPEPDPNLVEFVNQTFTAADGTTVESLPNMVKHPLAADGAVVTGNEARAATSSGGVQCLYYDSTVPPSADYSVTATLDLLTDNNSGNAGPMARMDPTVFSGYHARYNTSGNAVQLYRFVNGSQQQIASVAVATVPTELTIECTGDQISAIADGTVVLGPITDDTFAGPGYAGFRFAGATGASVGVHIDTLTAASDVQPTEPTPPTEGPQFVDHTFSAADGTLVQTLTNMVKHPLGADDAVVTSNRARPSTISSGAECLYYDSTSPWSADYEVTATLAQLSANGQTGGPMARVDETAFSGYHARYNTANGSVELYLFNAGSQKLLDSVVMAIPTTLTIRCVSNQVTALADGTVVLGPLTDDTLAGIGHAGFRFAGGAAGATVGLAIDELTARTMEFVFQAFTATDDTLLQDLTGLVKHPSATADASVTADRAHGDGAAGTQASYYDTATPASADYSVTATLALVTDNDSSCCGPLARMDPATLDGYWARYDTSDGRLKMTVFTAGTAASLGPSVAMACPTQLTLECIGDQISAIADGVRVLGPITDASHPDPGQAGLRFVGDSGALVGLHIDKLIALNTPAPAAPVIPDPTPPPDPNPVQIAYPQDFNDGILPGTNWRGGQFGASNTDAGVPAVSLIDPTDTSLGMPPNPPAYATKILQMVAGPDPLRGGGSARAEVAQPMSSQSGGVPPYVDANGVEYFTPEWMTDRTRAVPSMYFADGVMNQDGTPMERWGYWAFALPEDPTYRPGINYLLTDHHAKLGVNFLLRIHNSDPNILQCVIRAGRFEAQVGNTKPAWAQPGSPDYTGYWGVYAVAPYGGPYDSTRRVGEWVNREWDFVNHRPISSPGSPGNGTIQVTYSQQYSRFINVLNPIPWGTWITVEHRKVWSNDLRGGHQLWLNGNLVLDLMGIPTLYKWKNELKNGDVKVGYDTGTDPDQQNRAADYFAAYMQLQCYSGGNAATGAAKRAWFAPYGVHTSQLATKPWDL